MNPLPYSSKFTLVIDLLGAAIPACDGVALVFGCLAAHHSCALVHRPIDKRAGLSGHRQYEAGVKRLARLSCEHAPADRNHPVSSVSTIGRGGDNSSGDHLTEFGRYADCSVRQAVDRRLRQ